MPNEGQLGGFALRRLIRKFMVFGFVASVGIHILAISTFFIVVRMGSKEEVSPISVVYIDPSNLGPAPALGGNETSPGSFGGGENRFAGRGKPDLPPEEDVDAALAYSQNVVPTYALTPGIGYAGGGGGGVGFGGGGGTGRGGGSGGGGLATMGKYSPPIPVRMVWPSYPSSARKKGVKGTVVVRVHVSAEGKVDRAEIVSGLEDPDCRAAALRAAMELRFLPALLGTNPVDSWFSYPVEFGRK